MSTPEIPINNGSVAEIEVQGPAYQWVLPQNTGTVTNPGTITVPATIAASGTFTSSLVRSWGMPHIAVGAKLSQAGSIVVSRYLDTAGSVAAGAALTQALVADTAAVLDNNDGKVFQSLTVGIVNTGTVTANLTSLMGVLQSR